MPTYTQGGYGAFIDLGEMAVQSGDGVLVFDATGTPTFLASGSALDTLRVNSAGTALEFGSSGSFIKLGETTLGGAATTITVSSLTTTPYKQIKIFAHLLPGGANTTITLNLNNDSGTRYDYTYVDNGAATSAANAGTAVLTGSFGTDWGFFEATINNEASKKKGFSGFGGDTSSATNFSAFWNNTTDTITQITLGSANNFGTGSRLEVYGIV